MRLRMMLLLLTAFAATSCADVTGPAGEIVEPLGLTPSGATDACVEEGLCILDPIEVDGCSDGGCWCDDWWCYDWDPYDPTTYDDPGYPRGGSGGGGGSYQPTTYRLCDPSVPGDCLESVEVATCPAWVRGNTALHLKTWREIPLGPFIFRGPHENQTFKSDPTASTGIFRPYAIDPFTNQSDSTVWMAKGVYIAVCHRVGLMSVQVTPVRKRDGSHEFKGDVWQVPTGG